MDKTIAIQRLDQFFTENIQSTFSDIVRALNECLQGLLTCMIRKAEDLEESTKKEILKLIPSHVDESRNAELLSNSRSSSYISPKNSIFPVAEQYGCKEVFSSSFIKQDSQQSKISHTYNQEENFESEPSSDGIENMINQEKSVVLSNPEK